MTIGGPVVASLSAWGDSLPLDLALQRIREATDATVVELAIGALPVADPFSVLDAHRDRFVYIGHHTLPLGAHAVLRPTGEPSDLVGAIQAAGIDRYSAHPPSLRAKNDRDFFNWALRWHDELAEVGISFAVETMYPPLEPNEASRTRGYHLSTPAHVGRFIDFASKHDWPRPLLIDAAHLHIGWHAGVWTERAIHDLLSSECADELHVSSNDGVHDQHVVVSEDDRVWSWVQPNLDRFDVVVDEGRRRLGVRQVVPDRHPRSPQGATRS